ncbi:MAG: low molecular weight protein-tyrosine-phosphatase [Planctomycetia bacterium]|nr:low molecular weight protein-tyrosine-phosphatase [Planctomycetia bacterium]
MSTSRVRETINLLFVCHGNICRSPTAEFVMKYKVVQANAAQFFHIESAATSSEELGNPIYPGARKALIKHKIPFDDGKRARRVVPEDYQRYDLIIVMDSENLWSLKRRAQVFAQDPEHKIARLLDFTAQPGDVDDPWYHNQFDRTLEEISHGCDALLERLITTHRLND